MGKDQESIVLVGLTPRQKEILYHAGAGLTNREIAYLLGISVNTVRITLFEAVDNLEDKGIIFPEDRGIGFASVRGTVALAAKLAAEHGLIAPLPIDAKDALDFAQHFVRPETKSP